MTVQAILIGSLGVLTDLAELDRAALQEALAEAGTDWPVGLALAADIVGTAQGAGRLAEEALRRGATLDVRAVLARQARLLEEKVRAGGPLPLARPIREMLEAARSADLPVALVSDAAPGLVAAVVAALDPAPPRAFDPVIAGQMRQGSDPSPYAAALDRLGLVAARAIALVDSPARARAARRAGLPTLALPGRAHRGRAYPAGVIVTDRPTAAILQLSRAA